MYNIFKPYSLYVDMSCRAQPQPNQCASQMFFSFSDLHKDICDSQLQTWTVKLQTLCVILPLVCSPVCQGHSHKGIYQWEINSADAEALWTCDGDLRC